MNMVAWTGKGYVTFEWSLFKYLCSIGGYIPKWDMDKRINYKQRLKKVHKNLLSDPSIEELNSKYMERCPNCNSPQVVDGMKKYPSYDTSKLLKKPRECLNCGYNWIEWVVK